MMALSASVFALPAFATAISDANRMAEGALSDLQRIINAGASTSSLKSFFNKYADMSSMARTALGAPWRGMSAALRNQYVSAFENYLVKKYAKQFQALSGSTSEIKSAKDTGKSGITVSTAFTKGSSTSQLDMQVSNQTGGYKIVDLILNGASMVGNERQAVRDLLAKNGNNVDALIAELNS